jgi:integrase
MGKNYFYKKHCQLLKKLGYNGNGFDVYCWKHSGAIALFQATQDMEIVRKQCRHSDLATTQTYLRGLGFFVDYTSLNKVPSLL